MEHDEFFREVQEQFRLEPEPQLLIGPPPRTAAPAPKSLLTDLLKHLTPVRLLVAGAGLALILFLFWITAPTPLPYIPDLSPLFAVGRWVTLKAPVDGRDAPDPARRVEDRWSIGDRLFIYSYTARRTADGGMLPDHRWAIVKSDMNKIEPDYAPFDQVAPSLPPEVAFGTLGQSQTHAQPHP